MKTYNNLYKDLCTLENLKLAFEKTREGKSSVYYIRKFEKNFNYQISLYNDGIISYKELTASVKGWMGYAVWANTYKTRKKTWKKLIEVEK